MDAKPRPYRSHDDPLVKAAEDAALEIIRESARRQPWRARQTAEGMAEAVDALRRRHRGPAGGRAPDTDPG